MILVEDGTTFFFLISSFEGIVNYILYNYCVLKLYIV